MTKRVCYLLIPLLGLILNSTLFSEEYLFRAQVVDKSNLPIPSAECAVLDPDSNILITYTDSCGYAELSVEYNPTKVSEKNIQFDHVKGLTYTLFSRTASLTVLNILGQTVYTSSLKPGTHRFQLPSSLPSGRYLLVLKSAQFYGIISAMLMSGNIVGTNMIKGQYYISGETGFLQKKNDANLLCSITKEGFESYQSEIDPVTDFNDFSDIISLNKIPQYLNDVKPDTIESGTILKKYIENDDNGIWLFNSDFIDIVNDTIRFTGLQNDTVFNVTIIYKDSINENLVLEFSKTFLFEAPYIDTRQGALLVITESKNIVDPEYDELYQLFKGVAEPVFSDMFMIPQDSLKNLSFTEIVDIYGEAWINRSIREIAAPYYKRMCFLSDSTAIFSSMLDSLKQISVDGLSIDIIFYLHGSYDRIGLYQGSIAISTLIDSLNRNDINVRSLYQTCCWGNTMIDDWTDYGIWAVSGAEGLNGFGVFSPMSFLEQWIHGMSFSEAVDAAFYKEIDAYKSYEDVFPFISFLYTEDIQKASRQEIGGTYPQLYWQDWP